MFGSLMRFGGMDDEEEWMGAHMRNMNNMMNSMFSGGPFGMMGFSAPLMPPMMQMPNMNDLMNGMQQNGNCHSYSQSTVMSMTNGPDGRPQVYQATSSTRSAPGGIRETKKAVCDSRTGIKKMAIGHAIGDKAHIVEKEQNLRSGEMEERQDFINIDEEESDAFNREWQQKARQAHYRSLEYPQESHHRRNREELLALPESSSSAPAHNSSSKSAKSSPKHLPHKATPSTTSGSRKRDRDESFEGVEHVSSPKKQHQDREEYVVVVPNESTDKHHESTSPNSKSPSKQDKKKKTQD